MNKLVAVLGIMSTALCFSLPTPALTTVGEPGNPGKKMRFIGGLDYPRGAVDECYRIGVRSVSNKEYADFLNECGPQVVEARLLFDERMAIELINGKYTPRTGKENAPVVWVSRNSAARYCNYLTSGNTEKGTYRLLKRPQLGKNQTREVVMTLRDTTTPDSGTVYFLPTMHEYYKAGWYAGNGTWRTVNQSTAMLPSYFGMMIPKDHIGDWMENKYYATNPIAFGCQDYNCVSYKSGYDDTGYGDITFRIAATPQVYVCPALNTPGNMYFKDSPEKGVLRIRSNARRSAAIDFTLIDYRDRVQWTKKGTLELNEGITEWPFALPEAEGYYEIKAVINNETYRVPFSVFRTEVPCDAKSHFGINDHPMRHEQRFSFNDYNPVFLKNMGCAYLRSDGSFINRDMAERIAAAGIENLLVLPRMMDMNKFDEWCQEVRREATEYKDIVRYWELGNEPTYWTCTAEEYAQCMKAASKIIREIIPDAVIVSGDMMSLHSRVFGLNISDACDAIAEHVYGFYTPKFWGIPGKIRELRGWMNAYGIGKKPIWMTEIGTTDYTHHLLIPLASRRESQKYQMVAVPKQLVASLAFGCEKVMPYSFLALPIDTNQEEFAILSRFGYPRPAASSYRTTVKMLAHASFQGFMTGHSFDIGKIVGFHFTDKDNSDILVFWRNDEYACQKYKVPFDKIIHEPENVTIPLSAKDHAELTDICGNSRVLKSHDGKVIVPVDEYPVFVRGHFTVQHQDVLCANPVPARKCPSAVVKIIPPESIKANIEMQKKLYSFVNEDEISVKVRIFNLETDKELTGICRLDGMNTWTEYPWMITPEEGIPVSIPPQGYATADFNVSLPSRNTQNGIVPVFFKSSFMADTIPGAEFSDCLAGQITEPVWINPEQWVLYKNGYSLERSPECFRIKRADKADPLVILAQSKHPVVMESPEQTPEACVLTLNSDDLKIKTVNLLLRDANNETYQLKVPVKKTTPQKSTEVRFDLSCFVTGKGVIIHNNGDGNKKVDWPLRIESFNIEFDAGSSQGTLTVMPPRYLKKRNERSRIAPGDGGGTEFLFD